MFFGKRIKELRDEKKLLQRQLAAELEIDTPMYSKIERGERRPKREQVIKLAHLLGADQNEFIALWLASQVFQIIENESQAARAIELVTMNLNKKNN
ncbi:helix-turn-helix domain-containing protein [Halosquirtibacter xylanolyticus]|uniref:helix-turn-helix domain-containing protein n=1 Tax=Halosquirtibacter xylanolyticus TaxID=3374599 RepID=UPI003749B2B5|nr:helix-turn-helix domain-containing protein [Prolixibacteraceae bacterium]